MSYYQYDFPLSTLRLKEGDSLALVVRHAMKREILPGISDVGIIAKNELSFEKHLLRKKMNRSKVNPHKEDLHS